MATIRLYDNADLPAVSALWQSTLPQYPVSPQHLGKLLALAWGTHFVSLTADSSPHIIGFCATYTGVPGSGNATGYISALLIQPEHQGKGNGTQLLLHARDHLGKSVEKIKVSSAMPHFWSGVPTDLGLKEQEFFVKRGTSIHPIYIKPIYIKPSPRVSESANHGM
jgi:GNAT superfamily N-acetyltransferase